MPNILSRLELVANTNPAEALKLLPELFRAVHEGMIVELPCKVGSTVFCNIDDSKGDYLDECITSRIEYSQDYAEPLFTAICMKKAEYQTYWKSDFGKEIFLEPVFSQAKSRKRKSKGSEK